VYASNGEVTCRSVTSVAKTFRLGVDMPSRRQSGGTIENWTDKWVASVSDYSICAISVESRILTWNPGGMTVHGYEPDEIIGQMLDILYTEDDRQKGCPRPASKPPD
jgi:hypothetical protein